MTRSGSKALLAGALSAMVLSAVATAQAAPALPAAHKSGSVEYLSGGVGRDEAQAIEAAGTHWPLTLEFAIKDGHRAAFAADVKVAVRDAMGHAALEATAAGPFLLAKVPAGRYSVDATLAGKTLHERVVVKAGHPATAVFLWPAGTGESHVGQGHS